MALPSWIGERGFTASRPDTKRRLRATAAKEPSKKVNGKQAEGKSDRFGFILRLIKSVTLTALLASGLPAASAGVAYASTLNQNLKTTEVEAAVAGAIWRGAEDLWIVDGTVAGPSAPGARRRPLLAQAKIQIQPPPSTLALAPQPSGAEIVNKLLSPGPSDPNVPLPRADLAADVAVPGPSKGPQVYGRTEEGGGVFGLRVPIPADRNATGAATRYSPADAGSEPAQEAR